MLGHSPPSSPHLRSEPDERGGGMVECGAHQSPDRRGVRYTKLLQQASTEEVEATRGADHLGEDMLDSFWTHERSFRALVYECDLHAPVAHRIGSIPGAQLVQMRILELALHAADLSRGTGHDWPIDESLAEFISTELGDLIIDLGPEGGYRPPRPIGGAVTHAQRVLLLSDR